MPLLKGSSRAVISENIRREVRRGRTVRQAVAIAFRTAGKSRKKIGRRARRRKSAVLRKRGR